jgi:hypothetical protein
MADALPRNAHVNGKVESLPVIKGSRDDLENSGVQCLQSWHKVSLLAANSYAVDVTSQRETRIYLWIVGDEFQLNINYD